MGNREASEPGLYQPLLPTMVLCIPNLAAQRRNWSHAQDSLSSFGTGKTVGSFRPMTAQNALASKVTSI